MQVFKNTKLFCIDNYNKRTLSYANSKGTISYAKLKEHIILGKTPTFKN